MKHMYVSKALLGLVCWLGLSTVWAQTMHPVQFSGTELQALLHGQYNQSGGTDASGDRTRLWDGLLNVGVNVSGQRYVLFDLGLEVLIDSIVVHADGSRGDNFIAVSREVVDPTPQAIWGVKINVLRTNGSVQSGIPVLNKTFSTVNTGNTVYQSVGPLNGYRYIMVYNWSAACQISELRIHAQMPDDYRPVLQTRIDECAAFRDAAVVGSSNGQYPAASKTTFSDAITAAQAVADNATADFAALKAADDALIAALATFKDAYIFELSLESGALDLNALWVGEYNNTGVLQASSRTSALYDADWKTVQSKPQKTPLVADLGDTLRIKKIVWYLYNYDRQVSDWYATTNFFCLTRDPAIKTDQTAQYEAHVRSNNSGSNLTWSIEWLTTHPDFPNDLGVVTITPPAGQSSIDARFISVFNGSNTSRTSEIQVFVEDFESRVDQTGTWSDTSLWKGGFKPMANSRVRIQSQVTLDESVALNKLEAAPGAQLSVSNGVTATLDTLMLEGDLTKQSGLMNQGNLVLGKAQMKQYLTGTQTESVPSGRFWYVSSPFTDAVSAGFGAAGGNQLWSYTEAGTSTSEVYAEITSDDVDLVAGDAYVVRATADQHMLLEGSDFFHGERVKSLSYTASSPKAGFHLLGNPYPSYLNVADLLSTSAAVEPNIWCRSHSGSAMVFDTYNATTGTGVSASGRAALDGYVAPMQAFWIRATEATNITFNDTQRSLRPTGLALRKATQVAQGSLRLQVRQADKWDETLIAFYPEAVDTYDAYDARKQFNNVAGLPELYTQSGAIDVAINGLSPDAKQRMLPLGLKVNQAGSLTLTCVEASGFERVYLKDVQTGTMVELTSGAEYAFDAEIGTSLDRFELYVDQTPTRISDMDVASVECIASGSSLSVIRSGDLAQSATLSVFDVLGQLRLRSVFTAGQKEVSTELTPGVYVLRMQQGSRKTTQKIVINQ